MLPLGAMSRLAWRYLWRNYRRTGIMLLAIAVGVWAMVFMTALMRGMVDQMIEDGIHALPGMVQVHDPAYRDDPSIENSMPAAGPRFRAALDAPPIEAWTERVRVPAMISSERDSRGVTLLGVEPTGEIALGFDPANIVAGRFLEGQDDQGLVVGRRLLERLETDLGKRVVLMSQDPNNDIADRGFRIVGVFKGKLSAQEESVVYAAIGTTQSFLGLGPKVSEIAVSGRDYRDVAALTAVVRNAAPDGLEVMPWTELDRYSAAMLKVMDGFVLVWIIVIFIALSFGLANTLMMAVFERVREFGLMQALGMKPVVILYQVLLESLLLLSLGLLAGDLLAVATVLPFRDGIDLSAFAQGYEMMGVSPMLYPSLNLRDFLMANTVVIALGLLTSLVPAWRASQYRPVDAIART